MNIAPAAREALTPRSDTDTRSTWSIAWSCLTVVFACTWISVHPNIPAFDDTRLSIIRRRLRLMLIALIAPELVLLWAFRQWFGARDLGHRFGKGTTTQQGFFMLMGGFVDRSRKPIDPQKFLRNPFELAQIDDEDISDRCKSDFLGKGIAFLQTAWFVLQCIARSATPGLSITEIEVATLGFAALSAVQYILWFEKPLDVHRPIILVNADVDCNAGTSFTDYELQPTPEPVPPVIRPILTLTSIFGDPTYCSHIPPQAKRVPTFYAPPITQNQTLLSYMFAAITGTMVGAFHVLAWNLDFPTVYELHFWRVATVITASYPIMLFLYLRLVQSGWEENDIQVDIFGDNPSPAIWKFFFDVCVILGLLAYIASRVILMALACTTLRHLPTGSERKIGWAMHIPHL